MNFALIFLLVGVPLDLAELDAFPPAGLLAKWLECTDAVWGTLKGRAAKEAEKSRYALYALHQAQLSREGGDPVTARYQLGQAFRYRPEWRWAPYRVLIIPYHLMPKPKGK